MHVDNPENSYAKELKALLDTFGLTQQVQGPTHSPLDPVITKGINISPTIKDFTLSDHFCVFFGVSMSPPKQTHSCVINGPAQWQPLAAQIRARPGHRGSLGREKRGKRAEKDNAAVKLNRH